MPSRKLESVGVPEVMAVDELSDVDRLIADAEAVARDVALDATVEERTATATGKKNSAAAAERTEEVMRVFSSLRADDANVEDYCYEWVFDAYEAQLNIARPPKVQASIDALKKSGDALRKLAALDRISPELEAKMKVLQAMHDKLFDDVQAATVDALDEIKGKFKGEETEFERRFKMLSESPLVKGVEYDKDSPEAREKALKQEIVEVILGPIAESRLKEMETDIGSRRIRLEDEKIGYAKLKSESHWLQNKGWEATDISHPLQKFLAKLDGKREHEVEERWTASGFEQEVKRIFQAEQKTIDALEQASLRDRLTFEMNRNIIDETLAEEHDETALREAFVALRGFLTDARSKINGSDSPDPENVGKKFPYDNPLATLILGRLKRYGADLSVVYAGGDRTMYDDIPIDQQLIGRQIPLGEHKRWTAANALQGFAVHGFIRAKLVKATNEYAGPGYGSTPDEAATFYERLSSERDPGRDLKAAYPTKEEYLRALFGGETQFFNLRLAYDKAAAGLVKDKSRSVQEPPAWGVDALKAVGWKESKLGALVDPNQSVRDADREYARYLEHFSKPQADAEALFDVRDADGEFHVYTTEQAVSLLRRARRDARDIVMGADRTLAEGESGLAIIRKDAEAQFETLTARVAELEAQMKAQAEKAKAELARAKSAGEEAVESERAGARHSRGLYEGQITAAQKERDALVEQLRAGLTTALKVKAGMFSGDKELRERVIGVLESLPKKEG